jgi:RNA polymerase sigma-70 factor, ECF subfamily
MEKHCESKKKFGKKADQKARNVILEKFIQDYGERAFRFALKLSGNAEEARDLVQETSLRVLLAWDRYDYSRPLRGWFFSILWNAFLDSKKRARQRRWVALDAPVDGVDGACYGDILSDDDGDVLQGFENLEEARRVRRALRRLSAELRAVINLCDMNGLKYEDTARKLGVPVGTVRSRLFRARRALRNQSLLATE